MTERRFTAAKPRRPRNACLVCGRSDWVDAVDNHGKPYKGCAHCRILSKREIDDALRVDNRLATLATEGGGDGR